MNILIIVALVAALVATVVWIVTVLCDRAYAQGLNDALGYIKRGIDAG